MNDSPTIDRKRLERYPLATNPLLYPLFFVPILGFDLFLRFLLSPHQALLFDLEQSGVGTRTISEWMFARPWLALTLGLLHGLLNAWLLRSIQKHDPDVHVDAYFLSNSARSAIDRTPAMRRTLFQIVGCLIISFLGLAGICVHFGIHINIAFDCSVLVLAVVPLQKPLGRHNEILRRRRIALAWEGMDPADDRLTVVQKLFVGLLVLPCCALLPACAYITHTIGTHPNFVEVRADALHESGGQISSNDADALERRLEKSPTDLKARLELIGFYWARYKEARKAKDDEQVARVMERQLPHARYFIENVPGHYYTNLARSAMPFRAEEPGAAEIAALWRDQLDRYPDDAEVVWNAAWYFKWLDDGYCEELLRRGRAMEPKETRWASAIVALQSKKSE